MPIMVSGRDLQAIGVQVDVAGQTGKVEMVKIFVGRPEDQQRPRACSELKFSQGTGTLITTNKHESGKASPGIILVRISGD